MGGMEEAHARATDESLRKSGRAGLDIKTFQNVGIAFAALRAGQVAAVLSIDAVAQRNADQGGVKPVLRGLFPTPVALAFRDPGLARLAATVLEHMRMNGELLRLMAPYGVAPFNHVIMRSAPICPPVKAGKEPLMQVWNWQGFFSYLESGYLFRGALITIGMTLIAIILGFVLGLVLALMKRSPVLWLSAPARLYIWFFRGTPLLVQLVVIYAGLPKLDIRLSVLSCSIIGLTLNEGAYLAEIIRAGLNAVPKGQIAAARALGLSERQIARTVTFPQAFRLIIPPLGNSVNSLLKTTSVTSVISMEELMQRAQILVQDRFMVLELFSVAALYYLAMTTAWDALQRRLEIYAERPYRREKSVSVSQKGIAIDLSQDAR